MRKIVTLIICFMYIHVFILVCNTAVCRRPATVCICSCFPDEPLAIRSRVLILQHPNEVGQPVLVCCVTYNNIVSFVQESRSLATVPLLTKCVECHVIRGKRFDVGRFVDVLMPPAYV